MNRLRDVARLLLLASALGFAGYWCVTTSGPFGSLATAQASLFGGKYYPSLTGLLVFVCTIVPAGVIGLLLRPKLDPGPVEAFRADPVGTIERAPVALGVESLIGWPKAGVIVSAYGVELRRGNRAIHCPWRLFDVHGSPLRRDAEGFSDSILMPINQDHVGEVELRNGERVVARGGKASTPFFKWRGVDQVELTVEVPFPVSEFGHLLVNTAQHLRGGST